MFWIFAAIMCGVNIAPLFFPQLDSWHAQGFWVQTGILVLFSWSFFENGNKVFLKNKPLGLLTLWVGLQTAYFCFLAQSIQKYDTSHFLPYFNFLCLLIMYQMVISHLDKKKIEKILEYMRWMLIGTCFVCVLQFFGLSQVFELAKTNYLQLSQFNNNLVVGFSGNGTHLSGFLASCIPLLFLKRSRENVLILILLLLILTQTGTSKNDPSASGFIVALCIGYYYLYFKNRKTFWVVFLFSIFTFCVLFVIFNNNPMFVKFISLGGRLDIWKFYYPLFRIYSMAGTGLGTVNRIFLNVKDVTNFATSIPKARHLHLEYYHFVLELGIIGLILILNLIKNFFSFRNNGNIVFVLKAMVIGFLVSSLFNFPAHLWLPSTYAMFAYASLNAIKNEELLCQSAH